MADETTTTSATTAPESAAVQTSVLTGEVTPATTGTETQATSALTDVAETGQAKAPDADKKEDEVKAEGDKKVGAPEKYDEYKVPEGVALDKAVLDKFNTVAKELNLTQDQAQKLVDMQVSSLQEQQKQIDQNMQMAREEMRKETLNTFPEKERAYASTAWNQFKTPELDALMKETGAGDHPEIMRLFAKIGKAISEDYIPKSSAPVAEKSAAKTIFDNSNMK
jgi:uncharacterized protein (DUF4415 family)